MSVIPLGLIKGRIVLDWVKILVKLTDFRVFLCLHLFPRSVVTRLGLPVEDEVLRCYPK